MKLNRRPLLAALVVTGSLVALLAVTSLAPDSIASAGFARRILRPPGEAPFALRFFTTPVKTDSRGRIITGTQSDPVKDIVGAEAAGERGGLLRFTKIMFGCNYFDGRPDPGTRIDPNGPRVNSGSHFWPFVEQPFRGRPTSLALTADGRKLYVALPGREGYPDWRVAVVDTAARNVLTWIDVRPAGATRGTRPSDLLVLPRNASLHPNPLLVVLNEYGNFASLVDTVTDEVIGEFETGFYAQDLVANADATRLYVTDRFRDAVRVFAGSPGPCYAQIASVPTGSNPLDRANPRDLALSDDGRTLFVANTLGHTIAMIDVGDDANALVRNIPISGLCTDVKLAGRIGLVCGQETNSVRNRPETGHGLPTRRPDHGFIRNDGSPLGYIPVMSDATRATTFDDLGSEINVFDAQTGRVVWRYVDFERDRSISVVPGQVVDLGDHTPGQEIVRGSGPEQMFIRGDLLFVSMMHSDKLEVFRINRAATRPVDVLTHLDIEFTGGISPQDVAVSPDGRTAFVANLQTEDVSFLGVDAAGRLTRQGFLTVGVTGDTPDPTDGGSGRNLFATGEEIGLRWFFTESYSDDGQKSCGHCHWQSRHDGCQWNVGANAIGGVKVCPQNKDISDNWPEWYEGLSNDMTSYASSCNGELINAERVTPLFPQPLLADRLRARNDLVGELTRANSEAIGRDELNGQAFEIDFYDMAFHQILWSQNETRRMPNPLTQFPAPAQAAAVARGRQLFSTKVASGGAGCADCHHNGNKLTNGVVDDTFQDFNVHEPGVIAETTVDGDGPFLRAANDYFFVDLGSPQDLGSRQNIASRNTKHLRAFWDSVPRWLHHGGAHTIREVLLPPDSPFLGPGERGFNFRTVRSDHSRAVSNSFLGGPAIVLPTEVPITFADSSGALGGDGMGPILVSLDSPHVTLPDGRLEIDRLGTGNLAPLVVDDGGKRVINPALAANRITVIRDTHGKTSHLSEADIDALSAYLLSLE